MKWQLLNEIVFRFTFVLRALKFMSVMLVLFKDRYLTSINFENVDSVIFKSLQLFNFISAKLEISFAEISCSLNDDSKQSWHFTFPELE